MSYRREIPRDLFNEAKLLKCLGQLALYLHEKGIPGWVLDFDDAGRGFQVELDNDRGGLYCRNLRLIGPGENSLYLYAVYNSRRPYPLLFVSQDQEEFVFDDDGKPTPEFLAFTAGPPSCPSQETENEMA